MILGYLPIAAPKTLKEQKVAITSIGQEYKFTKGQNNYKTSIEVTYREQGQLMDIRKSNENFKNRKLKCFNCNKYGYITKECQSKKKEKETRKCFKYDNKGHIARDCKEKQSMKKYKVQEELDDKDNKEKGQGFGDNLKQTQYKRSSI